MTKKLLFSIATGVAAAGLHAQTVLSMPVSTSQTVQDPYSIRMLPGFRASADSSADYIFRAYISSAADNGTDYVAPAINYTSGPFPSSENYIYSRSYLVPTAVQDAGKPQIQGIQFFDGLGRPKQSIAIKSSPSGKDLVSHIPYDGFGRAVDAWLPVPMDTQNGGIQDGVQAAANTYYAAQFQDGAGNPEGFPFSHKTLENSPLDRIFELTHPGSDWQRKPVTFAYDTNVATEPPVKKYTTATTWVENATSSLVALSGNYPESSLYKNTVTDEDSNTGIEFKNGEGKTVLVRKMLNGKNIDTYYVYNEYGQLAYVVPPLADQAPALDAATLNNLCYQYRYDGRNRLVEKKLPGKGWEYLVYDKQDRLVATQDALLSSYANNFGTAGWLFTKYDQFGRMVYTGFTANASTRSALQSSIDGNAANPQNNEGRSATQSTHSGMALYYTNTAFPIISAADKLLSINYYDDYPADAPAAPSTIQGVSTLPSAYTAMSSNGKSSVRSTKGLPTASYVKNIEDDDWTKNYTYYDMQARGIGSLSQNYLGGYTKTESVLSFSGKPLNIFTYHKRSDADVETRIKETFVYDFQERLVHHKHQVDAMPEELLAENIYSELGQLEHKNVGGKLQTLKYRYNIRGWLTGMNDPANLQNKLFAFALKYQNPAADRGAVAKYNGNIAQMDWSSQSDGILREYSYQYDGLNRLTNASYAKPNATVINTGSYDESLSYDANGNIVTLQRFGDADQLGAIKIDELSYTYAGNQLQKVSDASQNSSGYPYVPSPNTVTYDANGNMENLKDRGITAIGYNFLNLPNYFTSYQQPPKWSQAAPYYTINNTYRADGVKLKSVYSFISRLYSSPVTTYYIDGFRYVGTQSFQAPVDYAELMLFPTSEGYFDFTKKAYIYNYVDHLGNVRLSYTKNTSGGATVMMENHFYPFGLQHQGYGVGANTIFNYNGKELQNNGMLDYGARQYMPDIGRWGVVDPLAEKYPEWSPYVYTLNNPIKFIDPDGRAVAEPPIKGIDYFKDKTGIYFWNKSQDKYEHYTYNSDGSSYSFKDYYEPSIYKGPVGDYEIIHNKKAGELAIKDIVKEKNYTDVNREDLSKTVTTVYSDREVMQSKVFVREKDAKDEKSLISTSVVPRSSTEMLYNGLKTEVNVYQETRDYGTQNQNQKKSSSVDTWKDMIKAVPDILKAILKK